MILILQNQPIEKLQIKDDTIIKKHLFITLNERYICDYINV